MSEIDFINLKEGRTLKQLIQKRKEELAESNMVKFANYPIGVHGVDLPKYNDAAHD